MGVLDARITAVNDEFYIVYQAMGRHGIVLDLGKTKDFKEFERIEIVSQPDTKAGALFPRKINNKFAMFVRPTYGESIWIAYSNDLIYWGHSRAIVTPRPGYWDSYRIGASVPPIKTDNGWLEIYHGVRMTAGGPIYHAGSVLLDLENPSKIVARCDEPILSPRENYERIGDVNNVVFASGAIVE